MLPCVIIHPSLSVERPTGREMAMDICEGRDARALLSVAPLFPSRALPAPPPDVARNPVQGGGACPGNALLPIPSAETQHGGIGEAAEAPGYSE